MELDFIRNICLSVLLVFLFSGCGKVEQKSSVKQEVPLNIIEEKEEEPQQQANSFTLTEYKEDGNKKWEIIGKSANILEKLVHMTDIVAIAYGEDNTTTLSAKEGTYNRESQDIHLEKDVVATTSDGARLTTDSLDWDEKERIVTTDDKIRVNRENIETTGKGGLARPDLKYVQLKEDVEVKIDTQSSVNPTIITCDGPLEVDYEKNLAIFHNNVIVTDEKGKIFADKMDVYVDPKANKVDRVFATGNVRIVRGENTTYSEQAEYIAKEGRVILTGSPKLVLFPEQKKDASP